MIKLKPNKISQKIKLYYMIRKFTLQLIHTPLSSICDFLRAVIV